jgi:hypothetical protein
MAILIGHDHFFHGGVVRRDVCEAYCQPTSLLFFMSEDGVINGARQARGGMSLADCAMQAR